MHENPQKCRPQSEIKAPVLPPKPADATGAGSENELKWEHLNETEKSAASLGVNPDSWKPISFLNNAHHETLLKANALDDGLAKKLEVRVISAVSLSHALTDCRLLLLCGRRTRRSRPEAPEGARVSHEWQCVLLGFRARRRKATPIVNSTL